MPSPVVFINVFTVDPPDQHRLIDLLTRATELTVRDPKGFGRQPCTAASMGRR